MYVTYRTSIPAVLNEIRLPRPHEILRYLDLCLEIGWPVTLDVFQNFCYYEGGRKGADRLRDEIATECCIVLGDWLREAGVELDAQDQQILDAIYNDVTAKAHLEAFHSVFSNKYLQRAHQIYAAHRIINAIHTYNGKLQQTLACYRALRLGVNNERNTEKYPRTLRYYLENNPEALKQQNPKLSEAIWKLNEVHRTEIHDVLYGRQGDPFGLTELTNLMYVFYDEQLTNPHPVLGGKRQRHLLHDELRENAKTYQGLLLSRHRFHALKPTQDEIEFCRRQLSGYDGWWQSNLCRRIGQEKIWDAVELFDLVTRRVFYEFVAPDGTVARVPLTMPETFACSSFTREIQQETNICFADDATLRRYYELGKQLEIRPDTHRAIIHPLTPGEEHPPWWVERMKQALNQHNADAAYDFYLDVEDPWRICQRTEYLEEC